VYATIPISTALVARGFGLERLAALKMIGAAVALGGVVVLFAGETRTGIPALPVFAIYLATVFAALGSTMLKRGPRQDPLMANAIGAAVGAPVCLLASFLLGEDRSLPMQWGQVYPILDLAIVGSVVAFVVFAWLVNHWNVTTLAFIGVVVPVIAVVLGALVRHEVLHRQNVTGSLLVLAGLGLAIVSDRRALARAPASRR
jgi:drug/metabolite transporter (DMT)-like permease